MKIAMLYPELLFLLCTAQALSPHGQGQMITGEIIPMNSTEEGIFTFSVQIGTPPEQFLVLPYTQSPFLWLSSKTCEARFCEQRKKFNCRKSSTCESLDTLLNDQFFDTEFIGHESTDTVKVGSASIPCVSLAEIILEDETYRFPKEQHPEDGFLGLSPTSESGKHAAKSPLVKRMLGYCEKKVLGFHLTRPRGSLAVCTLDQSAYQDPINYVSTVGGRWTVISTKVTLGGETFCKEKCYVSIETGSPTSKVPPELYRKLSSGLKKKICRKGKADRIIQDTTRNGGSEDLLLIFEFPNFNLTFRELYKQNQDGSCGLVVSSNKKSPKDDKFFTLGTGLLRQYYTILHLGGPEGCQDVGFANLKNS